MKRNNKVARTISLLLSIVLFLTACKTNGGRTISKAEDSTVKPPKTSNNESTEYTEDQETTIGIMSLDDCKDDSGIYIAYDDGSFDHYPVGGYCKDLGTSSQYFSGMYMENSTALAVPDVDHSTKIAVFCDTDYTLSLHPIHAEVAAFRIFSDDLVPGYGRLGYFDSERQSAYYNIVYQNHESKAVDLLSINGEPISAYEPYHKQWTVRSHQGISQDYTYQIWGFTGKTVTLGIGNGTTLEEETYLLNSTYYDCDIEHNEWSENDIYNIKGVPTAQGYAVADLSDVPSGKYVMVFNERKSYSATIINIVN